MASFAQLAQLARVTEFQQRVSYAMSTSAVAVYSEVGTTPGHTARAAFAVKVVAGSYSLIDACLAVLTNATIAAEANIATTPGNAIPDTDIQFAVNSIWNLLAGA